MIEINRRIAIVMATVQGRQCGRRSPKQSRRYGRRSPKMLLGRKGKVARHGRPKRRVQVQQRLQRRKMKTRGASAHRLSTIGPTLMTELERLVLDACSRVVLLALLFFICGRF